MKKTMKDAIGGTVQDMLNAGLNTSFTLKELNALGVIIPDIKITPNKIKKIRQNTNLSQNVFARLLNVSPSSVRQWEQGKRQPTGSTKVLLELLDKSPEILNYRIVS